MYDLYEKKDFVCAMCHAINEEYNDFCFHCSYELDSNYCTNETCDSKEQISVPLPRTHSYCGACGSESTYFRDGLIETQIYEPQHN